MGNLVRMKIDQFSKCPFWANSILYASPAWWGFTDTVLLVGFGSTGCWRVSSEPGIHIFRSTSFEELARLADDGLFSSISSNPDHFSYNILKTKNLPDIIYVSALTT